MARSKPCSHVSVGDYDVVTGLTHITHQRGRLLFNMGSSAKKQQRFDRDMSSSIAAKRTLSSLRLDAGQFTGLSLYPEEAYYLIQRQALVIQHLVGCTATDRISDEISTADFTAILAKDTRVSLAFLEVYTFLKSQKLHPRRCLKPLSESSRSDDDGRSVPQHITEVESCDVAFDVWKTVTIDDIPSEGNVAEAAKGSTHVKEKKESKLKQKKQLMLVFRVAVYRYWDAAPSPQSFRQVLRRSIARDYSSHNDCKTVSNVQVPVKVAVVNHDQSVLMFDISSM